MLLALCEGNPLMNSSASKQNMFPCHDVIMLIYQGAAKEVTHINFAEPKQLKNLANTMSADTQDPCVTISLTGVKSIF